MIQVLTKFSTQQEDIRLYLSSLFYFIDYLLQVPEYLKKKLTNEMRPLIREEAYHTMRAEKEKLPPTIAELFAEGRKEVREEVREELAKELILENFSDEYVAKLSKLDLAKVKKLRESMQ